MAKLENLEVDVGISYVDTEPSAKFEAVFLYEEQYVLLVAHDSPLAKREQVTWAEAGKLPLCLLTPDMQNRRLIDRHLADAGVKQTPTLESNSLLVLYGHVRTGEWVSILPARLAETLDRPSRLQSDLARTTGGDAQDRAHRHQARAALAAGRGLPRPCQADRQSDAGRLSLDIS